MNEQGRVAVVGDHIEVGCSAMTTRLALDSTKRLRDQYSLAVFAHERQCGQCDLTYAYGRGASGFDRDAARYTQDQIDKRKGPPT